MFLTCLFNYLIFSFLFVYFSLFILFVFLFFYPVISSSYHFNLLLLMSNHFFSGLLFRFVEKSTSAKLDVRK